MATLGERLDAAIKAAGKTQIEVAYEAGTTNDQISLIVTGKHDNPGLQLLIEIATAAKTTVAKLLGESFEISAEDERELRRFRGWIDGKLPKIKTRLEPNAVIVSTVRSDETGQGRVAEGAKLADEIDNPFEANVHLQLRVLGESMVSEGILPGDLLYAIPPVRNDATSVLEKIIACRLGDGIFVKRLVSEHDRLYLRSSDPRYRAIQVDRKDKTFEVLGIVIGRVGRID
jgi:transcriptional regulator with XRE-family HTH domain